jgi:lysozyme
MQISPAGLALIKAYEKCRLAPYPDSAGRPTIYWGHLIRPGETFNGTQEEADAILQRDTDFASKAVGATTRGLTQDQFDALCCFCFNVGSEEFLHSTLLKFVQMGAMREAADEFHKWDHQRDPKTHALVEVNGLLKRREAERNLFLGQPWSPP